MNYIKRNLNECNKDELIDLLLDERKRNVILMRELKEITRSISITVNKFTRGIYE